MAAGAAPSSQPSSRSPTAPPHHRSFGASATPQLPSISSKQEMANTLEIQDESEMGPNTTYQPSHPAQYPQPAYSYSRGPGNFSVDQDMSMVENYAHGMPSGMNQIDTALQESNGHSQSHGMSISTSNVPGMAPPQTPHQQSFSSPTGARPSIDNGSQDMTNNPDGSKRKRSKVSRACDECRRKKIKCDATDDDGTVKTCSNCTRAGQTCEYSRIPMKRGPSKGYIKELSERVQQVESQMAMSGGSQAPGYRQSLDGNMPIYPESSYSPDEPMSLKRNFSFSEARSNPFAQPQFTNRDRMPSTGGWSNTSGPPGTRPRDRGSVAVAPDQLPDVALMPNGLPAANYSKPFWAQEDGPPTKRQKTGTEDEENIAAPDEAAMARDLELGKSILPILTPPSAIMKTMKEAPFKLQHAVSFALCAVHRKPQLESNAFQQYAALEAYVWDKARLSPEFRSREENITWMLLYLLMSINADHDLARFRSAGPAVVSKGTLLKLAVDLGQHLKSNLTIGEVGDDVALIRNAWNFTCLLARLYALSSGAEDPIPLASIESSVLSDLPAPVAFLVRASDIFAMVITAIEGNSMYESSNIVDFKLRKSIEHHIHFLKETTPTIDPALDRLMGQVQWYVEILMARYFSLWHPVEILAPALELATSLVGQAQETWTPMTAHMFALSAITLLEFTDTTDAEMVTKAKEASAELYRVLLGLVEAADGGEAGGFKGLHWAEGLSRMIDARMKQDTRNGEATTAEGESTLADADADATAMTENGDAPAVTTTEQNGAGEASLLAAETRSVHEVGPVLGGDKVVDLKTGTVQQIDFRLLLRHGYLNVVAERNGL